jgi:acyl-CoA synthetase (AMP-forming)/AMP-acid ligase II
MGGGVPGATWSAMVARWRGRSDPAVLSSDVCWSGDEFLARSAGAAEWLDGVGAEPGRPVLALVASTPTAFALLVGAAGSGRPLAPLGPLLTAHELAASVQGSGCRLLVTEPAFEKTAGAVAALTGCRVEVVPEPDVSSRDLTLDPGPDDVACIIHTSGTTGAPKPVSYRQDRLARRVDIIARLGGLGPGCRLAVAAPFHHVGGLGNVAVALAATAATVALPRFSVPAWREVGLVGTTHGLLVPTMLDRLLAAGALGFPTLRVLQYGGAPMPPVMLARTLEALPGVDLVQMYGQTEGSPITCLNATAHRRATIAAPELLGTVGRAVPGIELRIEGPDRFGIGQVSARGSHLCLPDDDGWLRTGDFGRIDTEGYLHLAGRLGDRIVRGGENVHPLEVEGVLGSHPAVREVAVVGVPDGHWGEVVKAFVVPVDPARPPTADELRSWVRAELAGFKVPTEWAFVEGLPRNAAGKILRRELVRAPGGQSEYRYNEDHSCQLEG